MFVSTSATVDNSLLVLVSHFTASQQKRLRYQACHGFALELSNSFILCLITMKTVDSLEQTTATTVDSALIVAKGCIGRVNIKTYMVTMYSLL